MRFRKRLASAGPQADAALLAAVAEGYDGSAPVVLADDRNMPNGPQVGRVAALEFTGGHLVGTLEVADPEVARRIDSGLILGAASVVSASARKLRRAVLSNRPSAQPMLALTAAGDSDTIMLTAQGGTMLGTTVYDPADITAAIAELAEEAGMPEWQMAAGINAIADSDSPGDLGRAVLATAAAMGHEEASLALSTAYGDSEYVGLAASLSGAERRALAAKGQALPDGSYPIPDREHLHSAAVLAASGHGDVKAARALIRKRAHELGVDVSTLPGFGDSGDGVQATALYGDDPNDEVTRLMLAHAGSGYFDPAKASTVLPEVSAAPMRLSGSRYDDAYDVDAFGLTAGEVQDETARYVELAASLPSSRARHPRTGKFQAGRAPQQARPYAELDTTDEPGGHAESTSEIDRLLQAAHKLFGINQQPLVNDSGNRSSSAAAALDEASWGQRTRGPWSSYRTPPPPSVPRDALYG